VPKPQPVDVLVSPSIAEAERVARDAVSQHKTLVVVGKCRVDYVGRAKSKLEPGERILIVKKDGSLLVHRSIGYEPVNWQPPGCIFHTQARDNMLEIHAIRQKPHESVKVLFDHVQLISALSLEDSGEFSLYASEEDMQKAILLKPSLIEEDLKLVSYEKKVEPGFVDVYAMDKNGNLVVIEIKRKVAGKEAALQLARYIDAIKTKSNRQIRGILVAPDMGKDVQRTLATLGLEFKQADPKKCADILHKAKSKKLSEFFGKT
jgi:RecB family endonuclease NucS